jgi:hypothetical protein
LFHSLDRIQRQFNDQSEIIKKYDEIDKKLKSGDGDLLSAIDKFFDNLPTYVDGEKVGAIDYISYNSRMMDSLRLYKDYYEYCNIHYGVSLRRKKTSDSTYQIVSDPPTRADTASHLVPYYNKFVYKKDKDWYTITNNFEDLYNKEKARNNELTKEYNALIKEQVRVLGIANKKIKEYHDILVDLEKDGIIHLKVDSNKNK